MATAITLVLVYEDEVKAIIIKELNKNLKTEIRISPADIDLTFISSFPKCAIEFKNVTAMEVWSLKEKDTLLFASHISLRFSLKDIFDKKYDIKQIRIKNAKCFPKINKAGLPNYEVWKTDSKDAVTENDSLNFKLEDISLENIAIVFKNSKQKFKADFVIEDLQFKGNFGTNNYEMVSDGIMFINVLTSGKISYLKNKKLTINSALDINANTYKVRKTQIVLNKMSFDIDGDFKFKDSLENMNLNYNAKNVDIESVLSLLPEKNKERIADYKSSGEFFARGSIKYSETDYIFKTQFGINNATVQYTPKGSTLTNVNVKGDLKMDKVTSYLHIEKFIANLNNDNIDGKLYIDNFSAPLLDVVATGKLDLQNLHSFWPIDTLEKLQGHLNFDGAIKGTLQDLKQSAFSDKVAFRLDVKADSLILRFKKDKNDISIEECKIKARDRNVNVENLKLKKGNSDIELNGTMPGLFNYITDSKSSLVIKGALLSKNLSMEDFIFSNSSATASSQEFNIPSNVNLILDADIKKFTFGKFEASEILGNFELKNQKAMITDMRFKTMEGEAIVDALADASGKELQVSLQSQLHSMNVKKMFYQFNNFNQATLTDKNIKGFITATINFSGNWNKKLEPLLNTIVSTADFNIEKGELIEFKPLESLAKFVELQELKRIKFSTLSSNIEIRKNTIFIPNTTIKNSVLNLDFSGTHTFNNDVDYHIRLLISELLAKKRKGDDEFGPVENDPDNRRSAFILMTGNIDNLSIKYDRKGLKQKIKEDIKHEKQNLKQILKEEFGAFKKDTLKKAGTKADQRFELEKPNNNPSKKTLEPKKKKDDDDDF